MALVVPQLCFLLPSECPSHVSNMTILNAVAIPQLLSRGYWKKSRDWVFRITITVPKETPTPIATHVMSNVSSTPTFEEINLMHHTASTNARRGAFPYSHYRIMFYCIGRISLRFVVLEQPCVCRWFYWCRDLIGQLLWWKQCRRPRWHPLHDELSYQNASRWGSWRRHRSRVWKGRPWWTMQRC
jgi:hypothetical protein